MNNYFEHYSRFIDIIFVTTVVCAAVFLLALITLTLALFLFGRKNRGLYVINKTLSITVLVASILMTVVYVITIGLVAISDELIAYQGAGVIGAVRDLTCGILLAPSRFGMSIDPTTINTTFIYIFYSVCMFLWAIIGYVSFIVSCLAQRSSRKARNKAVIQNAASADNPANVVNVQPAPVPAPIPVPVAAPVQPVKPVQDNTPIDDAPIRKLVPESSSDVDKTPADTAQPSSELTETPEKSEGISSDVDKTPADIAQPSSEVTDTPEKTEGSSSDVDKTPADTAQPSSEVTETPEKSEGISYGVEKTPTDTAQQLSEVADTPEKAEEKPIDEDKILNLVATPPAENTVANDKPLFCMTCGTALNGGAFCINCGTPAGVKKNTCKNCNAELAKDARFCMVCGTKV